MNSVYAEEECHVSNEMVDSSQGEKRYFHAPAIILWESAMRSKFGSYRHQFSEHNRFTSSGSRSRMTLSQEVESRASLIAEAYQCTNDDGFEEAQGNDKLV